MDLQLNGQKAVVTGSTAGIGLAIAQTLAQEGAEVAINGRTQERVDAAIASIRKNVSDARLIAAPADLQDAAGCNQVIEAVPQCDILVSNAGIFDPKPFGEISDEEWLRFFQVNVMHGVRLARAYLPGMLERNRGRIVFISSESGLHIPEEMIQYGMTKTAQLAVARGLAETTKGTAVTVNSVLPGPTNSEGVGRFVSSMAKERGISREEMEREFFQSARPTSLLQRFETPQEIADVVAFVVSARAAAVNGASVRAEGGVVRAIG